jgi:hypothetical protein
VVGYGQHGWGTSLLYTIAGDKADSSLPTTALGVCTDTL